MNDLLNSTPVQTAIAGLITLVGGWLFAQVRKAWGERSDNVAANQQEAVRIAVVHAIHAAEEEAARLAKTGSAVPPGFKRETAIALVSHFLPAGVPLPARSAVAAVLDAMLNETDGVGASGNR